MSFAPDVRRSTLGRIDGGPVRFSNELLTLWYGTEDAPAPVDGDAQGRQGVAMTLAVSPVSPLSTVTIRYRVDGGCAQTLRAVRIRSDLGRDVAYYRAVFPDFPAGESVEYLPMVACAGRSAPDSATSATYPSSFRLSSGESSDSCPELSRPTEPAAWTPSPDRFPFAVDYLATIRVPLGQPETIGPTPEGIRVNWYWSPAEGVVSGPKLNARVRSIGGDWMTIRRDGVGLMDVRATMETTDGALLWVEYQGYYELGPNGYQDFLNHRLPVCAPTRTTPRFHTASPAYLWLNRVQCIGIGEVTIESEVAYTYDLYAIR